MKIFSWLEKILEKILPPSYGVYQKGSFPTHRKLSFAQAKELILEGGQKNRWEKETEFTFSFLKKNFLDKDREIFICDYGAGIGRLCLPILKEYSKTKIVAVDESESLLKMGQKWIPAVFFEEKRIEFLKPAKFFQKFQQKTFDLIISVYVFQHIFLKELEKLLPILHNLLKDDGRLFLVNTFQNDDNQGRIVKIKDLLNPYFKKESEISPYENKEDYLFWMREMGAGYGNWQEMENARPRCQKFMGIYRKISNF